MDANVSESIQNDLTSTVDVAVESSGEKQGVCAVNATTSDSIPSSSSDANTGIIMTDCGQDDPISSTSDTIDVFYKSNLETSATKTSVDAEADLFANDLNISDVPTEKITEDVEDIVNDLENLLGESSDFSLTKSSKLETTELVNENFQELLNNFEEVENTEKKLLPEEINTTSVNVLTKIFSSDSHTTENVEVILVDAKKIENETIISQTEYNEQQIADNLLPTCQSKEPEVEIVENSNNSSDLVNTDNNAAQTMSEVVHNIPDVMENSVKSKEDLNMLESNEIKSTNKVEACEIDNITTKDVVSTEDEQNESENVCDKLISEIPNEKLENLQTKAIPSKLNDLSANIQTEIEQSSDETSNLLNTINLPTVVLELTEDNLVDDKKVSKSSSEEKNQLSNKHLEISNEIETPVDESSSELNEKIVELIDNSEEEIKKDEDVKIENLQIPSCLEDKYREMHEEVKECLASEVEVEPTCILNENIVELSKLETVKETEAEHSNSMLVKDNIHESSTKNEDEVETIINVNDLNLDNTRPEKDVLNADVIKIEESESNSSKQESETVNNSEQNIPDIAKEYSCKETENQENKLFQESTEDIAEKKIEFDNKEPNKTVELPNISNETLNIKEADVVEDAALQNIEASVVSEISLSTTNCVETEESNTTVQCDDEDESNSTMQCDEKDKSNNAMECTEKEESNTTMQCAEKDENNSTMEYTEKDESNTMKCTEKDESNITMLYAAKLEYNSAIEYAEEDESNAASQCAERDESNRAVECFEKEESNGAKQFAEGESITATQYLENNESNITMQFAEKEENNSSIQCVERASNKKNVAEDVETKEHLAESSVSVISVKANLENKFISERQTENVPEFIKDISTHNTEIYLKLEQNEFHAPVTEGKTETVECTESIEACNFVPENLDNDLQNKEESPIMSQEYISDESSKSSADNRVEIIIESDLKDEKDVHVFESISENVTEHLESTECSNTIIETRESESDENLETRTEQIGEVFREDVESMQNEISAQLQEFSTLNVKDNIIDESNADDLQDNLESRIINEAVNSIIEKPLDTVIFLDESELLKESFSNSEDVLDSTKIDLCDDTEQAVKAILNPILSDEVIEDNCQVTEDVPVKKILNINSSDTEAVDKLNNVVESSSENIIRPENLEVLNKVLTIEVDDIQSETYETSNDEPVDDLDESKPEYSSRISKDEDLKMTITKQKPEESHSILKIYNPEDVKDSIPKLRIKTTQQDSMEVVPKLNLKAMKSSDSQNSPKRIFRNSPKSSDSHSPKLRNNSPTSTKSSRKPELLSPLKLTIKPVVRPEEMQSKPSPKITIKPITKPEDKNEEDKIIETSKNSPKLKILLLKSEDHQSSETPHNPKITIKPITKTDEDVAIEQARNNPKITIKPIPKPEDDVIKTVKTTNRSTKTEPESTRPNPKVTIKPVVKTDKDLDAPKVNPKVTIKPIIKPEEETAKSRANDYSIETSRHSPKITIKPIIKPEEEEDCSKGSPKITIKPIVKPEEESEISHHSPKITIKPILKTVDDIADTLWTNPKVTIKPIIKPDDDAHSPKIIIKPIPKPPETSELNPKIPTKPMFKETEIENPKITIKPIQKHHEHAEVVSPRITIKPIVKPSDEDSECSSVKSRSKKSPEKSQTDDSTLIDFEDQIKQERIVLKIQKNIIPTPTSSRKREFPEDEEKSEKLGRIKLKFSKEGGHTKIVSNKELKRQYQENLEEIDSKRSKIENDPLDDVIEIVPVFETKEKEVPKETENVIEAACKDDPLDKIPVFEITPESAAAMKNTNLVSTNVPATAAPIAPAPRKRGRPRKVPLEVREEFKDESQPAPQPVIKESTRPKRSCRGPSVRTTLGIKPRKPRGPGRGRGGKRGTGRVGRPPGRPKLSDTKLKLLKATVNKDGEDDFKDAEMRELDRGANKVSGDVVMYEEETRMSAETSTSSRAHTPAKQIPTPIVPDVEESQSSVQSSATTESVKVRRSGLPRLEVHKEPEGAVISADQLAEYYWGGGGPYMLQEQVAQFLGIKSFKRKYPGIKRRPVEMQERDFIREQSLASEAMCDLGLTAVNSSDILDIMYSDFQHKYEEYCKHQRDRQVKDLSNKQRALSLAASQEKNKYDIVQQAVQSAATWNASFNKSRREERKACMDLQTFTVNYPKGRAKQISKPKIGNYPLALVPGQFTDYYKMFTPTEINNLPLNTICYTPINIPQEIEDSNSDCSGTESDSSSSDSDSSTSDSSDEDCNLCTPPSTPKNVLAH